VNQTFVEKGTYLQLSEMTLGYQLDRSRFGFLRYIGANRVQIDLVGRNLMTFSKFTGLNPAASNGTTRVDAVSYPFTRTFTLATTITF
jgi:TonB-dependent starch-binding outer membrane protein SusC